MNKSIKTSIKAVMAYMGSLLGDSFSLTAAVASLDRAVIVLWVISLGFVLSFCYSKQMSTPGNNNKDCQQDV